MDMEVALCVVMSVFPLFLMVVVMALVMDSIDGRHLTIHQVQLTRCLMDRNLVLVECLEHGRTQVSISLLL